MSGRNSRGHRQVARYTGAPQGRRRQVPVRQPSQMGSPYQMVPYQMGPYGQVPYQMPYQMPYQVINNYQIINYQRTGYRSRGHAMQCPDVQRAISTHGISRSSKLDLFLSMLTSGSSILASLVSIGIFL